MALLVRRVAAAFSSAALVFPAAHVTEPEKPIAAPAAAFTSARFLAAPSREDDADAASKRERPQWPGDEKHGDKKNKKEKTRKRPEDEADPVDPEAGDERRLTIDEKGSDETKVSGGGGAGGGKDAEKTEGGKNEDNTEKGGEGGQHGEGWR
eukprot:TRINITY_DN4201_c1_g1_i1.p3 TRINITY_DN4201_c1_g1~~TRINITY_DN4201_c1_g1_i1.p3  ORF type:complete len:176 (-),score=43.49 TRINITY_DN4201_c1_g1_i1:169-624(-)